MELNPVKFIHLFMCRVWQEIYSLPIAFSLFLSPHFSLWADVYCMFGLNGMSKTQSLFILHQKHSFKWPDIFLERLDGPHHNMRWFPPSAHFFFSPSSLKMYFYFSSIKPVVSLRLFVDFLCRYNNFLRDLTENTSPDSAEFQQLSSKSFFHFSVSQPSTNTHSSLWQKCWWVHPAWIVYIIHLLKRSVPQMLNWSHPKPTLVTCLPSILVCHFHRNL